MTAIVWFRQDLRLSDNEALLKAAKLGQVLPIYIFDDCAPHAFKLGAASKVWLHHSLDALNKRLGGKLNIYVGQACEIIQALIKKHHVSQVFCNACYEPWHQKQVKLVQTACQKQHVGFDEFNSNYLWGMQDILKADGSFYKVFTAYKNKALQLMPRALSQTPKRIEWVTDKTNRITLNDLNLLPKHLKWHQAMLVHWEIGEVAAHKKLHAFIEQKLVGYKQGRDFPAENHTSCLSPHLHFGEISTATVWHAVQSAVSEPKSMGDRAHFLSELVWREFSVYLLCHFNQLPIDNFNQKFDHFPWENNTRYLKAWQSGQTGYPIIDAGMRELWQTGYMHNRVRMIVASFLIKNLNIHWRQGQAWFWDCLVDADLANNSASWQWVAGSGADAAPYFRIFNPITQGEKFDKHGEYTRRFVPELKNMPDKYLFKPWAAPLQILDKAGVVLGETYPKPIVDLQATRQKALEAYKRL